MPVIYQPNRVILGQGWKRGYPGDEVFEYGPDDSLALPVPRSEEASVW